MNVINISRQFFSFFHFNVALWPRFRIKEKRKKEKKEERKNRQQGEIEIVAHFPVKFTIAGTKSEVIKHCPGSSPSSAREGREIRFNQRRTRLARSQRKQRIRRWTKRKKKTKKKRKNERNANLLQNEEGDTSHSDPVTFGEIIESLATIAFPPWKGRIE